MSGGHLSTGVLLSASLFQNTLRSVFDVSWKVTLKLKLENILEFTSHSTTQDSFRACIALRLSLLSNLLFKKASAHALFRVFQIFRVPFSFAFISH